VGPEHEPDTESAVIDVYPATHLVGLG